MPDNRFYPFFFSGLLVLFLAFYVLVQEDCHRHYLERQRVSGYTRCLEDMRTIEECQEAFGMKGSPKFYNPLPNRSGHE